MNASRGRSEREVLDEVAREYERKGFKVVIEPSRGDLPEFLRDYRPDALATRGEEHVVIEVSASSNYEKGDALRALAHEVPQHSGYKLDVVLMTPAEEGVPADPKLPTVANIHTRLPKIRDLYMKGERAAAFLLLWSLLEAVTRHRLAEVDVERRGPQAPIALVKDLVSFGRLEQEDYDRMAKIVILRNAIAHGHTDLPVEQATFDELYGLVEKLVNEPQLSSAE